MAALNAVARPNREGRFAVPLVVPGGFFALDTAGRATLLVPVSGGRALVGREVGGLSVSYDARIKFEVGGREWESAAIILSCLDVELLPTFCSLALDVASRVAQGPQPPVPRTVSDAIAEWERLLRARHNLTPAEELGLWGELWVLARMHEADLAVDAWRGPEREAIDFLFGSVALECKASTQRLRHDVSQRQLERPAGDAMVYVASLWIGLDAGGETLSDVVQRIDARLAHSAMFEAKLLSGGYSRLDAALYRQRFSVLEDPLVFPEAAIPRVRVADPGVSGIRFTVVLDDAHALTPARAASILRGPCNHRENAR